MFPEFQKLFTTKRFVPLVAIAFLIGHAHAQCYVDPYTGQRYCTGPSGTCPSCGNCPSCNVSRPVAPQTPTPRATSSMSIQRPTAGLRSTTPPLAAAR